MPAEKLTKQRLIHITVILAILSAAFFWRTYHYSASESLTCEYPCQISIDGRLTHITAGEETGTISVDPAQKSWSVIELSPQIKNKANGQVKLILALANRSQFTLVTGMHKKYIIHIKNR
ncbi:hypothetical protein VR7878_01721 [Vibrio ruber DSM 16370]|uniref:Uncharacterized protein n=1 Tax=Vibrio ruber (strain DSM 16370 / JCM 11486 / BCRC 17186 / CECT 7878 / LMG 23124 / VR1) TaxID=1123498 RepID=A0A1R4LIC2_VIBR1|nr:hypothetical protein [Vibrio ruber]SJN56336.1 hypothetical protein VR7878_01721 [Vibrio ruber DSM 16370]